MPASFSTIVLAFAMLQAAPSSAPSPATAQSKHSAGVRKVMLTLPHALRDGETAWLLVKVGVIGRSEIRLTTEDGHPLGAISPFGVRSGQPAGTYTVPVPAEVFHDGRLALQLSVVQSGGAQRAPTKEEVPRVRLLIRPFGKQPPSGASK